MGISDRINAHSSKPVSDEPATTAPSQPDQFWKSVKGNGLAHLLALPARADFWLALSEMSWGCLAQNIVGFLPSTTPEQLDNFPLVLARNMRVNGAMGGEPLRSWSFDYGVAQGCWVKMVDGSVVHFQQVQSGVHISAWLYQVFGGNSGQAQVTLDQAIVHHTIVGLGVTDIKELITEALGGL